MIRKTPYANLIGVFTSESELKDIHNRLRDKKYSPYVIRDGDRFRIYVGAFVTLRGTRDQKSELQIQGIQSKIVRH